MNYSKVNKRNQLIIGICFLLLLILVLIYFFIQPSKKEISLGSVHPNYRVKDRTIMELYQRFQIEDGKLFSLMGSSQTKDYYGYYYQKKRSDVADLSDIVKSFVVLENADYMSGKYNEEGHYYEMPLAVFQDIYVKIFGQDDSFQFSFGDDDLVSKVEIVGDNVLIYDTLIPNDYHSVIDTYFVNGVRDGKKIFIYERVAFIKITNEFYEFYADIDRSKLVYKIGKDKIDNSFVNDASIVSDVLLKYQDRFPLATYTYELGIDSYYFKSIEIS